MTGLHAGWYLLAFVDELVEELTPVRLGRRRLMLVRSPRDDGGRGHTLYDATCPHRGADLSRGGVLAGECVTCPFHGRRIALEGAGRRLAPGQHAVRSYPTLTVGPLVFGRLSAATAGEHGFEQAVRSLLDGRTVVPALRTQTLAPARYVVENAFDGEHFGTVHAVPGVRPMTTDRSPGGPLTVRGSFVTRHDPWGGQAQRDYLAALLGSPPAPHPETLSAFTAAAFSPTLVAAEFGAGDTASVILTGAVPDEAGCQVRVAVAGAPGRALERTVEGARRALAQDVEVWDHLDPDAPCSLDERDAPVVAFQDFCRDFPAAPETAAAASTAVRAVRDAG
ncbi:MAG TPA: Rieske 2Fe-2S domain-containing protein [Mycobacteriales bacterium]|jgi:nitrite reductase/ring-hydroxylating ferredoxin subunit|nr:Rieske 2Fe-2S domain-containing protein [Mycobacteriales bacterium]